jgi:hypothetical protein
MVAHADLVSSSLGISEERAAAKPRRQTCLQQAGRACRCALQASPARLISCAVVEPIGIEPMT